MLKRTIVVTFLVQVVVILFVSPNHVGARAPPSTNTAIGGGYEGGSDYLVLEEDEDEFPAESVAFLRSMAQSFRGGFANSLSQGGAAAEGLGADGGEEGGSPSPGAGGGLVMKYIMQIFEGFQAMRKSVSEMFQQIATNGGQRLAKRVADRLGKWAMRGQAAASSIASQAQDSLGGAGDAASAAKPFR